MGMTKLWSYFFSQTKKVFRKSAKKALKGESNNTIIERNKPRPVGSQQGLGNGVPNAEATFEFFFKNNAF